MALLTVTSDALSQTASHIPLLSHFKYDNELYILYKVNYSVKYSRHSPSCSWDLFHLLSDNFWTVSDFSPSPTCSSAHFTITVFFLAFLIAITSPWHQLNPWSCVFPQLHSWAWTQRIRNGNQGALLTTRTQVSPRQEWHRLDWTHYGRSLWLLQTPQQRQWIFEGTSVNTAWLGQEELCN